MVRQASQLALVVGDHYDDRLTQSDRFACLKDGDRFAVGEWTTAATGVSVLADAAVWLDCLVSDRARASSHTVFFGEVRACALPDPEAEPLLYWHRDYRRLDLPRPELASTRGRAATWRR